MLLTGVLVVLELNSEDYFNSLCVRVYFCMCAYRIEIVPAVLLWYVIY